ncbi:MAG: UDP-N-acetylmuramate dehydrogenase [Fermentimonas sp.]|nr:UDP-N-acetylmuramate dehydrogenase [Fermentimonas sp.]
MKIQHNKQLQQYNSFRTKAVARLFCEPQSVDELSEILKSFPDENKLILGAGNNLFFTKNYDGLIIKPAMYEINIISDDENFVEIEAGAAVEWDNLVEECVSKGYSGLENLSLIPGSVGASPIQNIGAYGSEAKDTITLVKTVDIKTGEQKEFTNNECRFGYRDSIFKQTRRYIITSVIFRLNKSFTYEEKYVDLSRELKGNLTPSLSQIREAIIAIRSRKLPDVNKLPNAGSFFKNPILTKEEKEALQKKIVDVPIYNIGENSFKTSAAFLIEKAGFKGKSNGKVGTYENHALVIINLGTEDGNDILNFAQEIRNEVDKQFGIKLEPEVWIF